MLKHLSFIVYVFSFFALFTSCQRKSEMMGPPKPPLTLEDAKAYYQRLVIKYGNYDLIKVDDKVEKSFKEVDFSKAFIGENETSFFVEAPISYTIRAVELNTRSKLPKAMLQEMHKQSFDRLVIYKDKISGMVNEKVVTFMPSADYIAQGLKNLHNNHYQSLAKEFSGYVSNKDWKGKFQSSQSYQSVRAIAPAKPPITAKATTFSCEVETHYSTTGLCILNPSGWDCYINVVEYEVLVCSGPPPPAHNHTIPIPGPTDPYWNGWPDPQNIPGSDSDCRTGPRYYESPIAYAAIGYNGTVYDGNTLSVTFEGGGCFCYGYSFLILEDVATGTEYPFPIENQNFILPNCTSLWESNVQIPANVPNGWYYVKVWQDGDVFYHQYEKNGVIQRYIRHLLQR